MLEKSLFSRVLIEPASKFDRLEIVSGYATANMLVHHFDVLKENKLPIHLDLIVGMAVRDGILDSHHEKFKAATSFNEVGMGFNCKYVTEGGPVHAKSFCWFENNKPKLAFVGSANYTRTGFDSSQVELVEESDPKQVADFFKRIDKKSTLCTDEGIAHAIRIHETWNFNKVDNTRKENLQSVNLPLVKRNGEIHDRSGLNWGQRPGRDKDQAYIPIPKEIRDSHFFPERGKFFQVKTDDNKSFTLVRAQDEGKSLHDPEDNARLGRYLRYRMGIPSGEFVSCKDLDNYGRTDITFHKVDDESYLLDFSVINQ